MAKKKNEIVEEVISEKKEISFDALNRLKDWFSLNDGPISTIFKPDTAGFHFAEKLIEFENEMLENITLLSMKEGGEDFVKSYISSLEDLMQGAVSAYRHWIIFPGYAVGY
jgi:hypothetical protein